MIHVHRRTVHPISRSPVITTIPGDNKSNPQTNMKQRCIEQHTEEATILSMSIIWDIMGHQGRLVEFLVSISTLRKDFVILQLHWWLFISTNHCS